MASSLAVGQTVRERKSPQKVKPMLLPSHTITSKSQGKSSVQVNRQPPEPNIQLLVGFAENVAKKVNPSTDSSENCDEICSQLEVIKEEVTEAIREDNIDASRTLKEEAIKDDYDDNDAVVNSKSDDCDGSDAAICKKEENAIEFGNEIAHFQNDQSEYEMKSEALGANEFGGFANAEFDNGSYSDVDIKDVDHAIPRSQSIEL